MALEIELKAWVDDRQHLEALLGDRFPEERSYERDDTYYCRPDEGSARTFRLRIDNGQPQVTFKDKQVRDGVEVNREREFGVDNADMFREFMQWLGYREYVRKHKQGRVFRGPDPVRLELVHVRDLGDFLELEALLDEQDQDQGDTVAAELRGLLASLGIAAEQIESRYYIDMLREQASSAPHR